MASHSSGTGTPSTDPSQQQQQPPSSYLSYPVSHVVSGLYRRLTDNAPTRLPKVLGRSASHQPEKAGSATLEAPTNSHAGLYTPPNRNASPFQPPPLTPLTLSGADDDDDDPILTNAIAEEIRLLVPPRLQLAEHWRMIYSLERDGVSLHTLYNKCASSSTPQGTSFVLVVQDGVGGVCLPKPTLLSTIIYSPNIIPRSLAHTSQIHQNRVLGTTVQENVFSGELPSFLSRRPRIFSPTSRLHHLLLRPKLETWVGAPQSRLPHLQKAIYE